MLLSCCITYEESSLQHSVVTDHAYIRYNDFSIQPSVVTGHAVLDIWSLLYSFRLLLATLVLGTRIFLHSLRFGSVRFGQLAISSGENFEGDHSCKLRPKVETIILAGAIYYPIFRSCEHYIIIY
jgi:hypothetical protein